VWARADRVRLGERLHPYAHRAVGVADRELGGDRLAAADTLRYPLTGLPAPDMRAFTRRPLCVKVADPGGGAVLTGVELADMVYETADSGSSSQLACVFQSAVPKRIGPVGMAGMPDLWIVPQYGAALFSLGAPAALSASIAQAGLLNFSKDTTAAAAYVEGGNVVLVDGRAALAALKAAHSSRRRPQHMCGSRRA